jgi:hypothetical protein
MRILALTVAILALASAACGDDSGSTSPTSGKMDLATDEPLFTITFRPGDLQGGAPASIASGDFNADGAVDLLLGAPYSDGPDAARTDGGEAYILYGPIEADIDLAQAPPDVRVFGASQADMLGAGVAAGDLNGDGVDDVIVGAPGSNGNPEVRTDMGEAYVVFGRGDLPATIDTRSAEQDFLLQPAEGFSAVGKTFAVADVNDDGIDDLIAGAPYAGRVEGTPPGSERTTVGEVYVVYGSSELSGVVSVAESDEDARLSGVSAYDQFGNSVASADVDGDGIPDIVVGASGFDGPGGDRAEAGGAFVFYGGPDFPEHLTLNQADMTITGADSSDTFGTLVAAVDVNGDGRAEVFGTAPTAAGPINDRFASGEVAVIDPAQYSGPELGQVTSDNGIRIFAPTDGELMSGALAVTAGQRPRVAIGSILRTTPERLGAGWTYLLDASSDTEIDLAMSGGAALAIEGAAERQGLGGALAFVDLDGDGNPELLTEASGGVQSLGADPTFVGHIHVIRLP